jgi:glutamine---fructose-6-phosphate transaminase (isomerizing)
MVWAIIGTNRCHPIYHGFDKKGIAQDNFCKRFLKALSYFASGLLMTRFLEDILRQPGELQRVVRYLDGEGRFFLESSVQAIRRARHTYITGIGASWNAALAAATIFHAGGHPVYMLDAAELLQFSEIPPDSVIVILSRSGRSVEIVRLLDKARAAGARVIGITHFADGPLAQQADIPFLIPVAADHGISVNTYSALAAGAAATAVASVDIFDQQIVTALVRSLAETNDYIPGWQRKLDGATWLEPGAPYYFLGRGSSLASACEARLLWEEGTKSPATAMNTDSFRHGPLEVTKKGFRMGVWIDGEQMRPQDLAVARDLRTLGASVMLTGCDLPEDAADLVFNVPRMPRYWQFLVDSIPAQLAAERLALKAGADSDSFRFASYVVVNDHGLIPAGGK